MLKKITLGLALVISAYIAGCNSDDPREELGDEKEEEISPSIPWIEIGPNIDRLSTFARVATSIEFFHPNIGAENTDWDKFIAYGMYRVSLAANDEEFASILTELFKDITPTVTFNQPTLANESLTKNTVVYTWEQVGYKEANANPYLNYSRKIISQPFERVTANNKLTNNANYTINYGNVYTEIPLILNIEQRNKGNAFLHSDNWTLPKSIVAQSGCLAAFARVWGVIQHFWPYHDSVDVNWLAELPNLLQSCEATNRESSIVALRYAITKLEDNHVEVNSSVGDTYGDYVTIPIGLDWIENQLTVTYTGSNETVKLGDKVIEINDQAVEQILSENAPYSLTSTFTQNYYTFHDFLNFSKNEQVKLTLINADGEIYQQALKADFDYFEMWNIREKQYLARKESNIIQLESNIALINIADLKESELDDALALINQSHAAILDLRSYPNGKGLGYELLSRFISVPASSLPLYDHWLTAPDRTDVYRQPYALEVLPRQPFMDIPVVVLSSRLGISANEHMLGYFQSARIPIIGDITAGINGSATYMSTFGGNEKSGVSVRFTGMEYTQLDGSPHIGVGIIPDLIVPRTVKGIKEGRDNQLEAAIEYVSDKLN